MKKREFSFKPLLWPDPTLKLQPGSQTVSDATQLAPQKSGKDSLRGAKTGLSTS